MNPSYDAAFGSEDGPCITVPSVRGFGKTLSDGQQVTGPLPSGRNCAVLRMRVDEVDYDTVINQVKQWAWARESRYMCVSNVHMTMEVFDDPDFRAIVNGADLVGADGMPVIQVSRWLGLSAQRRVFGPELMVRVAGAAAEADIPVAIYGSTQKVIDCIKANLTRQFPKLQIAYAVSPPFRPLSDEELEQVAHDINESGARIVFVGLGCPKQERWMNTMRNRVLAPMLGVGWAFDVIAGTSVPAAPWMQRFGLEWIHRLMENPRKMWWRTLKHNPRFVVLALLQLCGVEYKPRPPRVLPRKA